MLGALAKGGVSRKRLVAQLPFPKAAMLAISLFCGDLTHRGILKCWLGQHNECEAGQNSSEEWTWFLTAVIAPSSTMQLG